MKIQILHRDIADALCMYYERQGVVIDKDTLRLKVEMITTTEGWLVGVVEAKTQDSQQSR